MLLLFIAMLPNVFSFNIYVDSRSAIFMSIYKEIPLLGAEKALSIKEISYLDSNLHFNGICNVARSMPKGWTGCKENRYTSEPHAFAWVQCLPVSD